MIIPRPLRMRWMGLFIVYLIAWTTIRIVIFATGDDIRTSVLALAIGFLGFVSLVLSMIYLADKSTSIRKWLLGDWI